MNVLEPATPDGVVGSVVEAEFAELVDAQARLRRLWTGSLWVEGPAWLAKTGELLWSDVRANRIMRWREADNAVSVFREPASGSNGNSVDLEGRLLTCEQSKRRITRTELDESITVLADRFEGRRFNAPNDIVVAADGAVWFTDPDYGASDHYEGDRELDGCHVYRVEPATGQVRQMTDDMVMPNGLAFSPDQQWLYVVDTGSSHFPDGPNHIRRFRVGANSDLSGGEVMIDNPVRGFDGLRVDAKGRLWCGAMDGVHCYNQSGQLLGKILVPERVANLTFGGQDGDVLFMCATTSIYSVKLARQGLNGAA